MDWNGRRVQRPRTRAIGGGRGRRGAGRGAGRGGENSNGGAYNAGRGRGAFGAGGQNAPANAPTGPAGRGQSAPRGGFNQGGYRGRNGCQGRGRVSRGGSQDGYAVMPVTTSQKLPKANGPPLDPAKFSVALESQRNQGSKRKHNEDKEENGQGQDDVHTLKAKLEAMTRLKDEEQEKLDEMKIRRRRVNVARLKAEHEAAEARAHVLEIVRHQEQMAGFVEQLRAINAKFTGIVEELPKEDAIKRAEQARLERLLADARADWGKDKKAAAEEIKFWKDKVAAVDNAAAEEIRFWKDKFAAVNNAAARELIDHTLPHAKSLVKEHVEQQQSARQAAMLNLEQSRILHERDEREEQDILEARRREDDAFKQELDDRRERRRAEEAKEDEEMDDEDFDSDIDPPPTPPRKHK